MESGHRAVIVFLTVCTRQRRPLLASPVMQSLLIDAWRSADRWRVGRYVIMPDHVHLFCSPNTTPPCALRTWVSYWKALFAKASGEGREFWQQNFWDTQLRSHESYTAKWEYVRANPVRAGLVQSSEAWPYQGELNVLHWLE